jgi:hypothetical protein
LTRSSRLGDEEELPMGHMKDFDRRIRQGGDDAVRAALEYALTVAARWIPVEERLPEHGEEVLAYFPPQPYCPNPIVGEAVHVGKGNWSTEHGGWFHVTHWMPLPEPPEVTK